MFRFPGFLAVIGAVLSLGALACERGHRPMEGQLRVLVREPRLSTGHGFRLVEAARDMSAEDELWLIAQLLSDNHRVRGNATIALSESASEGAAAALYIASRLETEHVLRHMMLGSLGRLGDRAKTYLLKVLKEEGPSPVLLAALAQTSGVKPRYSRHAVIPAVSDIRALQWWERDGKKQYGHLPRPVNEAKSQPHEKADP